MLEKKEIPLVTGATLLIIGFIVTQGDWPRNLSISEPNVQWYLGRKLLDDTIPGAMLMLSGAILLITGFLKK
ncbi:hypothetical protein DDZ13_08925 [Coraliomargarita sinensis]|uniref:DUF3185 domain-containing protein n=1 Tax=Coraliomargarita sinensis TaxID=2174842 RepID=A0A317ZGW2_9BACT|nr:hypothetical protein [Coraliomargarita sinensis]PXA04152.1 hypothetical protein DDZ13_08925 [Coraliomargarita sinensis]